METIFIDTHILLWISEGNRKVLSQKAIQNIERAEHVHFSPMVLLELHYLKEIKRITSSYEKVIAAVQEEVAITMAQDPLENIIQKATHLSWTRDVFDRLITAHAALKNSTLVTKDQMIRKHYEKSLW